MNKKEEKEGGNTHYTTSSFSIGGAVSRPGRWDKKRKSAFPPLGVMNGSLLFNFRSVLVVIRHYQ